MRLRKQETKMDLLKQTYPDISDDIADKLHMVKISKKGLARIQLKDKSWIIDKGGKIHVFGPWSEDNHIVARVLADSKDCEIEVHETSCQIAHSPAGTEKSLQERLNWWKDNGAETLTATENGIWISWHGTYFFDQGNSLSIYEPITDEAIKVMVETAKERWCGRVEIFGDEDFKQRYWAEAERQGVKVVNYEPPEKFKLEQELGLNQDIRLFLIELSKTGSFAKARDRKTLPPDIEKSIEVLHSCKSNPLGDLEIVFDNTIKAKKFDYISFINKEILKINDVNKQHIINNLNQEISNTFTFR
ncbi:hypothetical protein GCM10011332_33430 [Terasakiella brassicae]|uniref:Large polyvalent protein-associated domain-containing protein n=2 Tax=Terasakiella brassicae TaxID=1634917 RepID=A0A917C9W8_9PROT|nr:hypothetical protein GCM10011332_33430 [Terasakiella brassicae]